MLGRMCIKYLEWRGLTVRPPQAQGAGIYDEDGLTTIRNHDFVDDPRFNKAVKQALSGAIETRYGHHGRWNFHVVLWAAAHATALKADIVQLGVFAGTEAAAIVDFLQPHVPRLFLIDTFTGVPAEQWTEEELRAGADSAQWAYKEAGDLYERVTNRFRRFPHVSVIRGKVPDILPLIPAENIGLLMLDMNAAAPERAAAEFFWERIVKGGLIVSDDYGHSHVGKGYYAQKVAFDNFARSKGVPVLSLPTGHGLIVKP